MKTNDIRQIAAFALLCLGFLLMVGTLGKYEFEGYISAHEFLAKIAIGIGMMAAAFPVSGELDLRKEGDKCDKGR